MKIANLQRAPFCSQDCQRESWQPWQPSNGQGCQPMCELFNIHRRLPISHSGSLGLTRTGSPSLRQQVWSSPGGLVLASGRSSPCTVLRPAG
jgi:hypothetical protein